MCKILGLGSISNTKTRESLSTLFTLCVVYIHTYKMVYIFILFKINLFSIHIYCKDLNWSLTT